MIILLSLSLQVEASIPLPGDEQVCFKEVGGSNTELTSKLEKRLCEYSINPAKCISCVNEKKQQKEASRVRGLIFFFSALSLAGISLIYLIVEGIFYAKMRRILGKKWLIYLAIGILILFWIMVILGIRTTGS